MLQKIREKVDKTLKHVQKGVHLSGRAAHIFPLGGAPGMSLGAASNFLVPGTLQRPKSGRF